MAQMELGKWNPISVPRTGHFHLPFCQSPGNFFSYPKQEQDICWLLRSYLSKND
jgi:hypothetical protein